MSYLMVALRTRARHQSFQGACLLAVIVASTFVPDVQSAGLPQHLQEFEESLKRATRSNIEAVIHRSLNHSRRLAKFTSLYQCHGFHKDDHIPPYSTLVHRLHGEGNLRASKNMSGARAKCSPESLAMTHAQKHAAMNDLHSDEFLPVSLLEMTERVRAEEQAGTFAATSTDAAAAARTRNLVDGFASGLSTILESIARLLGEPFISKIHDWVISPLSSFFKSLGTTLSSHSKSFIETLRTTPKEARALTAGGFVDEYNFNREKANDKRQAEVLSPDIFFSDAFKGPVGQFYLWEVRRMMFDLAILIGEGLITMGVTMISSIALWIYRLVDLIVHIYKNGKLREEQAKQVDRCGKTADFFEAVKRFQQSTADESDLNKYGTKEQLIKELGEFQTSTYRIADEFISRESTKEAVEGLSKFAAYIKSVADTVSRKTTKFSTGTWQNVNEYMYNQQLEATLAGMEQVKYLGCKPEAAREGRYEFDEEIFMQQLGMQSQSCLAFSFQNECSSIALMDELMAMKSGEGNESAERRFFGRVRSVKLWGDEKISIQKIEKGCPEYEDKCYTYPAQMRDNKFKPSINATGDNLFSLFHFGETPSATSTTPSFYVATFDVAMIALSSKDSKTTPEGVEAYMRCMNMANLPQDQMLSGLTQKYGIRNSEETVQMKSLRLDKFLIDSESWRILPGIDYDDRGYNLTSEFCPISAILDNDRINKVVMALTDKSGGFSTTRTEHARVEITPIVPHSLTGREELNYKRLALARVALPMWSLLVHWRQNRWRAAILPRQNDDDRNIAGTVRYITLDPTFAEFVGLNPIAHHGHTTTAAITQTFQDKVEKNFPEVSDGRKTAEQLADSFDAANLPALSEELQQARRVFCENVNIVRQRGLATTAERDLGFRISCSYEVVEDIRDRQTFMIGRPDADKWKALAVILERYGQYGGDLVNLLRRCALVTQAFFGGDSFQQDRRTEIDAEVRSAIKHCPNSADSELFDRVIDYLRPIDPAYQYNEGVAAPVELNEDGDGDGGDDDGDAPIPPEGFNDAYGKLFEDLVLEGKRTHTDDLEELSDRLLHAHTLINSETRRMATIVDNALAEANACCSSCREKSALLVADKDDSPCDALAACTINAQEASGVSNLRQANQMCEETTAVLADRLDAQRKELSDKQGQCTRLMEALSSIQEIEPFDDNFCEAETLENADVRLSDLRDRFQAWRRDVTECRQRCRDVVDSAPMSLRALPVTFDDERNDQMIFNDICFKEAKDGNHCPTMDLYPFFQEHECPDALVSCQESLTQLVKAMIHLFEHERELQRSKCNRAEASFRPISDFKEGTICSDNGNDIESVGEYSALVNKIYDGSRVARDVPVDDATRAAAGLENMTAKVALASPWWKEALDECRRQCQDGWDAIVPEARDLFFLPFGFTGCTDEAFKSMPGSDSLRPGAICAHTLAAAKAAEVALDIAMKFKESCVDFTAMLVGEGNEIPPVLQDGVMKKCKLIERQDQLQLFQLQRLEDRIGATNYEQSGVERSISYIRKASDLLDQELYDMRDGVSNYISNLSQCRSNCGSLLARALSDTEPSPNGAPTELARPPADECKYFVTAAQASLLDIDLPTPALAVPDPLASCRRGVSKIEEFILRRDLSKCRARCRRLIAALPSGVEIPAQSTEVCMEDDFNAPDVMSCTDVITEIGAQVKIWEQDVNTCWNDCFKVRDASGMASVPMDICAGAQSGRLISENALTVYPVSALDECRDAIKRVAAITANAFRSELVECEGIFRILSPKLSDSARRMKGTASALMALKRKRGGEEASKALSRNFRSVHTSADGRLSLAEVIGAELDALRPIFQAHSEDHFEEELSRDVRALALCRVTNLEAYKNSGLNDWAARAKKRAAAANEEMQYINHAIEAKTLAKELRADVANFPGMVESLDNFLQNTDNDVRETKMKHRYLQVQAVARQQRQLNKRLSDCESTESSRQRCLATKADAERPRKSQSADNAHQYDELQHKSGSPDRTLSQKERDLRSTQVKLAELKVEISKLEEKQKKLSSKGRHATNKELNSIKAAIHRAKGEKNDLDEALKRLLPGKSRFRQA